ncbi:type II toxin-antitoxin system RelE/ParE family toxin [Methylocapsa sp. S129]|uniref:type II toxin-antitoxin system RelE/ParE family toxin n=1 Tax=Methylocapsa sp. S129 TaxID=1641869 RepID=UPI00131E2DA2|nr:type II toxin-antitoxin system RelE/ParE family toxin [Methylocapsa sp. S129]
MARTRLSDPAKADIAAVLRVGQTQHGAEARIRYRGLLTAAMRRVAADPLGPSTSDRSELSPGLRSLHIRHARNESREAPVAEPVHIIFFRATEPGLVEIVRVLHERMEPSRHVGEIKTDQKQ